jgi:hypothetical protein
MKKEEKKTGKNLKNPSNPHKSIEDEEPGQSAVGKHSPTQRQQNEGRDQRAVR